MATANLVLEIIVCLAIVVVGGGLCAAVVWGTLRINVAIFRISEINDLFERVIDNEAAVATQAEDMAKQVSEFKQSIAEALAKLEASEQAHVKAVLTSIVGVEGLAKAVKVFEKALLDLSGGKPKSNYDVAPDLEGLTPEQIEKREAEEMLRATTQLKRVYASAGPEIMATEE